MLCLVPFLAGRDAELSSDKHLTSASYGVTWFHHLLSLVAVAHRDSFYRPVLAGSFPTNRKPFRWLVPIADVHGSR